MEQIKDALQAIVEQAESKTELPPKDILKEAADISATCTLTVGLMSFIAKAFKTFKSAVKEEELKMQWQDLLRDRWGTNAPDLDAFI